MGTGTPEGVLLETPVTKTGAEDSQAVHLPALRRVLAARHRRIARASSPHTGA